MKHKCFNGQGGIDNYRAAKTANSFKDKQPLPSSVFAFMNFVRR